jgi:predicted anti-sigma-YlaC factor YlaD
MGRNDCEQARDLVPLLFRGQLLPHDAAVTEAHLGACAECRAEADVVHALARDVVKAPSGLEARVLLAVRRPLRRAGSATRLAMAATVAAAVLGGSVIFERWRQQQVPEAGGALLTEEGVPSLVSWGVSQDPLLQGSSPVTQLSVEELEILLQELDS